MQSNVRAYKEEEGVSVLSLGGQISIQMVTVWPIGRHE